MVIRTFRRGRGERWGKRNEIHSSHSGHLIVFFFISRPLDQSNSGTKLSKLKGAIKVAIDGTSVEAMESTSWDGFNDQQLPPNANILHKVRKERGQNLDQFMATFMQSIEQSTDVGEDVAQMNNIGHSEQNKEAHFAPGDSLVFGDHFELRKPRNGKEALNYHHHPVRGPSKCLVFIGKWGILISSLFDKI